MEKIWKELNAFSHHCLFSNERREEKDILESGEIIKINFIFVFINTLM